MRFSLCCVILLAVVAVNYVQSADSAKKDESEGRIFLSTFTVILSTVTSVTTIATTTTCTTSTSALKTCSVGRRRRGLFYDDAENQGRARRGLFYNDDEDLVKEESAPVKRSAQTVEAPAAPSVTIDKTWVPLTVESGFSVPDGSPVAGGARFKLAYGTSTVTSTSTSTATRSLTATCGSTTSFQLCSGAGK
ncbi:uncharacterized protein LOC124315621 [Daphnia pulicaria]|uniref:uncharacterized protein LOC124315621 n=1 Tax=Daphnia pulicaria TaxID=35523 RepID=UPI001EEBAF50|nr:uncharacterized protein LOC124315621 [Daphnia pulicaria]